MALQLVYTSAPKLLDAGRSGFGVVARSKNLPSLAANAIERFSKFANMQGTDRSRIVLAHRKVTIGNTRLHVLSRIRDSGSDHTGRTNHIAHHLIFSPLEIRQAAAQRLTPADVFAQFAWLDRWEGAPRAFDGSADVQIGNFIPQFAATQRAAWVAATGEPLHSRLLAWDGAPKSGALIFPDGIGIPQLLGEALAECQNPWEKTFTTSLELTDELAELDWVIAYRSDASAISRVSSRTVYDLTRSYDLPVPTEAALPKPDVAATASAQDTAPPAQGRVIPPPDPSQRPVYAQPNPATRREPAESRSTVAANTRGTGNGKLWVIIGGGIAALFLLIVTAFFLINASNTKRAQNEAAAEKMKQQDAKDKAKTALMNSLTGEGEIETHAKTLSAYPDLKELPQQIANTKSVLVRLSEMSFGDKNEDIKKILEELAGSSQITKLDIFPEGSFSMALANIVVLMRQLVDKESDKNAEEWTAKLRELDKDLKSAQSFNAPNWIKEAQINRIISILWAQKYEKLALKLRTDTSNNTSKELESFITASIAPEKGERLVSDEQMRDMHVRMEEKERKDYIKKLKDQNPKLLAMLQLSQSQHDAATPAPPADKPEKPAAQSDLSKFEDEEWCVIDPNEGGSFHIDLPKSKIIQAIWEKGDPGEASYQGDASYAFGDEESIKFNYFNAEFRITLQGTSLKCEKSLPLSLVQKNLSVNYQNKKIQIFFGKWPEQSISTKIDLTFKRVENQDKNSQHSHSYQVTLSGGALEQLVQAKKKTIPEPELIWTYGKDPRKITEGSKIIVLSFPPSAKEIEEPSEAIRKKLTEVLAEVNNMTLQKQSEKEKNSKKKNKKETKLTDEEHKEIWSKYGWENLKDEKAEYRKWIDKRLEVEEGSPRLNQIDKIGGQMDANENAFLNIIRNPVGKNFIPNFPSQIKLELISGKDVSYSKVLTVIQNP